MIDFSPSFADLFNIGNDRNFKSYLERTQTVKQYTDLCFFIKETLESAFGTVSVHPMTYTCKNKIFDIELTFVKSKSVCILYVAK